VYNFQRLCFLVSQNLSLPRTEHAHAFLLSQINSQNKYRRPLSIATQKSEEEKKQAKLATKDTAANMF
jgi:hypothetical protein